MSETVKKTVNLQNLTPWEKGVSGNPNGRPPKEFSFTEGMREFLQEVNPDTKKARKDELIQKVYQFAMRGDPTLIKLIINYLEGMPQGSTPQVAVQVNNYQLTPEDKENWAIKYLEGVGYEVKKT